MARYIRSFPQTAEFIDRISELLVYLIPHYIREGKSYLTIAFGCTGGHHRSVLIASEIRKRLSAGRVQGERDTSGHRAVTHPNQDFRFSCYWPMYQRFVTVYTEILTLSQVNNPETLARNSSRLPYTGRIVECKTEIRFLIRPRLQA